MSKEKSPQKEQIKVTDKRIFTPEGEIREEFRKDIKPVEPSFAAPPPPPPAQEKAPPKPSQEERRSRADGPPPGGERRRTLDAQRRYLKVLKPIRITKDHASGELVPNPSGLRLEVEIDFYQAKPTVDVNAARQMIEILTMLKEKTAGNLSPEEEDFLNTHLGELKLAFVQRTKSI